MLSRRTIVIILFAIIFLAAFLRLFRLATLPPGLYMDEAMEGNSALEVARATSLSSGFKVFYPEDNGREGLYVNCVALLIKVSGGIHEPWIVRLPASIFGILTVLGIYLLGAELFSAEIGLLAAFLLATSFWHIDFSRIGFRAIMAPLFLTWALYCLIRGFNRLRRRSPFWRAAALHFAGGVLWALGFYTYIAYRVSPALIVLVFVFCWFDAQAGGWRKSFIASMPIFWLSAAAVAAPLVRYFYANPGTIFGRSSQLSIFHDPDPLLELAANTWKTLAMFNLRGDANLRHNLSGIPELFWPVGILFLLGIVIGLLELLRTSRKSHNAASTSSAQSDLKSSFPFLLLFAWFLLAMLPVVLSNDWLPHALRSVLMIPCAILFAAVGGRAVYSWLANLLGVRWLRLAAFAFLALLAFEAYHAYFVLWARNPALPDAFEADYVALGRELNAMPLATPTYVVVEAPGVYVNGIPMTAQPVMFITDTFRPEDQAAKQIHYLLPANASSIPPGAKVFYIRQSGPY